METLKYEIESYIYKGVVIGHTWMGNEIAVPFEFREDEPIEIKLEDYGRFGLKKVEAIIYLQDIIGEAEDGRQVLIKDNEIKEIGDEDLIDKYMDYFLEEIE